MVVAGALLTDGGHCLGQRFAEGQPHAGIGGFFRNKIKKSYTSVNFPPEIQHQKGVFSPVVRKGAKVVFIKADLEGFCP